MRFPWQKKNTENQPVSNQPATDKWLFRTWSFSETGPARERNEDSIIYFHPDRTQNSFFAMIADGMGGHNAGEIASHIACREAELFIQSRYNQQDVPAMLNELVQGMHRSIVNEEEQNEAYHGMGTTSTVFFCRGNEAWLAQVGDSRLYHFSGNKLVQCSNDQTLVNQMVKEGRLTAGEAEHHEMKNILIQALGTVKKVEPEISKLGDFRAGDYYFLCSDGIYDVFSRAELNSLFRMGDAGLSMECMKALCYERKAQDNVSAILIEIAVRKTQADSSITREQNVIS